MKTILHASRSAIDGALNKLNISCDLYVIDYPSDLILGDYTTNVALVAAKKTSFHSRELALRIIDELGSLDEISRIDVAEAGFINFFIKREILRDIIANIGTEWGSNKVLKGKKILIEKSAPNLFKPFHVGHLLNLSIGESLSRLIS